MSETFRNLVFVLCAAGCLGVTILNDYNARTSQALISDTFESLVAQTTEAHEISLAQDYAMQVGQIAQYEASRAHELDQTMKMARLQFAKLLTRLKASETSGAYVKQLLRFVENNGLVAPAYDPKPLIQEPPDPNDRTAVIERYTEDGELIERKIIEDIDASNKD